MDVKGLKLDSKQLLRELMDRYELTPQFKKHVSPLIEKIFSQKTPLESRENLIEQVHSCCRQHMVNQREMAEFKVNMEQFVEGLRSMFQAVVYCQEGMEKIQNQLDHLTVLPLSKTGETLH